MLIGVVAETDPLETRVAASAETVKRFVALGAEFVVQHGAGLGAGVTDADYEGAGARMAAAAEVLSSADVLLKVRRPSGLELTQIKRGALVVAIMDPYGNIRRSKRWRRPASTPSQWSSCRASPARR